MLRACRQTDPLPRGQMGPEWTPALGLRAYFEPLSVLSPLLPPSHLKPKNCFSVLLLRAVVARGASPRTLLQRSWVPPPTPPHSHWPCLPNATLDPAESVQRAEKGLSSGSPWGGSLSAGWDSLWDLGPDPACFKTTIPKVTARVSSGWAQPGPGTSPRPTHLFRSSVLSALGFL